MSFYLGKEQLHEFKTSLPMPIQSVGFAPLCVTRLTFCLLIMGAAAGVSASSTHPADDVPDQPIRFNIKQQSIVNALINFGLQANVSAVIEQGNATTQSNPVFARTTAERALTTMLLGTGLTYRQVSGGFVVYTASDNHRNQPAVPDNAPTPPAAYDGSPGIASTHPPLIEEIVVTAQKRPERLQDVGVAITSFSTTNIRELGFTVPADIAAQTPGLDVKNALGSVNPIYTLRGIGLNDYNVNNNPSVGVYLDEIYLASAAYQSFPLFDVGPIEVLRGPQGTLYGRNSTGGAINIYSAKPTDEFEAYLDAELANWGTQRLQGAISGPLSSALSGRVAVHRARSDGYYTNNGNPTTAGRIGDDATLLDARGQLIGQPPAGTVIPTNPRVPASDPFFAQDTTAVRGILEWKVNPSSTLTASIHHLKDQSDMLVRSMSKNSVDRNGFSPTDNNPFTVDANFGAGGKRADITGWGGYIRLSNNWGAGELVLISGYESIKRKLPFEDSSPWRILDQLFTEKMYEFSQEIRLTVIPNSQWLWTIGGYYGVENIAARKDINGLDGPLRTNIRTDFQQRSDTWAMFAQTEWTPTPALRFTGGIRYSFDNKRYSGGSFLPTPPYGPYGVDLAPTFWALPLTNKNQFDEDNWSGKVSLDWSIRDHQLAYVSWRKGYKNGGFDGSTITSEAALLPFFGETLYAWELGFKSRWLGGKVQWNSAAFLYDYRDMQAESKQAVGEGLTGLVFESIRTNAGEASVWGIESDLWLKPAARLEMKLGISYLQTKITDWFVKGIDSTNPTVAQEARAIRQAYIGNHLPDSPEVSFNQVFKYTFSIAMNKALETSLNTNYVSRVYKNIDNQSHLRTDAYWLVNGHVALTPADGRWRIAIWGKNLTNTVYFREKVENFGPDWIYGTPGAPKSYGLTFSYRWQ